MATDKEAVLKDIAATAKNSPALKAFSEEQLLNALSEREKTGSTGFENGIAIPHCRMKELDEFIIGLLLVPGGVDFNAMDGKPSYVFFFIIGPENQRNEHIRILSGISRTLAIKGVAEELKAASSPENAKELFLRHVVALPEKSGQEEKSCFIIHIQEESKFAEILQAAVSLTPSVSVIEAGSPGKYLNSLPLFSTFWNNEDKEFHRVLTGLINKKLVNELLRSVNVISGGTEDKSGIMITIMDTYYTSGSLTS